MLELDAEIEALKGKIAGYEAEYARESNVEIKRILLESITACRNKKTELLRQRNASTPAPVAPGNDLNFFCSFIDVI